MSIRWNSIKHNYAPPNRKILLKRHDNIYCGILNKTVGFGKQNFWIDGYSKVIPRTADYWAEIPKEVFVDYV